MQEVSKIILSNILILKRQVQVVARWTTKESWVNFSLNYFLALADSLAKQENNFVSFASPKIF